jgi:hypothetical protein
MATGIIYSDGDLTISDSIAEISGTSYPIRAISSVTIRRRENASVPLFGLLVLTSVTFALVLMSGTSGLDESWGLIAGLAVLTWVATIISGIAVRYRSPYFDLILITIAGERIALTSRDEDYSRHIRAAIEQAINIGN